LFFTVEHFRALPVQSQLGLNIVSEGVGAFFENVRHKSEQEPTQDAFPSTFDEYKESTYQMIAYQGGYWLVKDIISQYGERGLTWLVSNPLFASTDYMRDSVVAYRVRALDELAKQRSSK
jgi:hypothetical protein